MKKVTGKSNVYNNMKGEQYKVNITRYNPIQRRTIVAQPVLIQQTQLAIYDA